MNDDILRLVRPEVLRLGGYKSARNTGKQHEIRIFLDANENPYAPYPATAHEVGFNRYPEVQPLDLRQVFAERNGVTADNVFLSRGADEAIDLLTRIFCAEGKDGVLLCSPTFPMYEHSVDLQGARRVDVPLTDEFQLDVPRILEAQANDSSIKVMMFASPNNPTANAFQRDDIITIARAFLGKTMVLIDQLYADYAREGSMAGLIADLPNVVIVRSLSKEHSMAGERVGITIADETVVQLLNRVAAPYLLSQSSLRAARAVASPEGAAHSQHNIERVPAERDRMRVELDSLLVVESVYPSDANFFLVKFTDAAMVCDALEEAGIKVRNRSEVPRLQNCVRVTVGTPDENDAVLRVLEKLSAS